MAGIRWIICAAICVLHVFQTDSANLKDVDAPPKRAELERSKRAAALEKLEVETVVILDEEYVELMRERGHDTDQSLKDLVALKFAGMQAEWSKSDILKYDVQFSIKEVVIWEQNPDWYAANNVLEGTLQSICIGADREQMWTNYDYIYLFTGRRNTDIAGFTYTGGVCERRRKCTVSSYTSPTEYYITVHESGHIMGMTADYNVGCTGAREGIMGYRTSGWSPCSVASLDVTAKTAACLKTTDVTDVPQSSWIQLQKSWPGMLYTDDEICAFHFGPGFRITGSRTNCNGLTCMNVERRSPYYGVSHSHPTPTDGSYCGEGMVCSTQIENGNYQCLSWNRTGLDLSLFVKVKGGWSDWQETTGCTRSCGTGIQYRQRYCNNPKPQNSAWCEGEEFNVVECNVQACEGDSKDLMTLVKQRAGETCANWKANNLFEVIGKNSANYLTTGSRLSSNGDDQCVVKCDTVAGYNAGGEKHGIMPDGTPCAHDSLSSFVEINGLPRRSGRYGKCLLGKCILFGCDGVSGSTSLDACGVCGGDGSTCQAVEGVYTNVLAKGETGTIAVLPTGARLIQFYFPYGAMTYHFFEVRTKDSNTAVINYRALDTRNNPVTFAGTYWYLQATKQFLYAQGPINQAVYIKLYNYATKTNVGVNYAYSIPTAAQMAACTGTCANNGKWNKTTCSCDCAPKFFGISCTDKCSTFCKNGQSVTPSTCKCNCQGNTYGVSCDCLSPFQGINCSECKVNSCKNGGTFVAAECRCTCPPGFGDLDCGAPCEDAGGAKCALKVKRGQCNTNNEIMERDCYMSCGFCVAA